MKRSFACVMITLFLCAGSLFAVQNTGSDSPAKSDKQKSYSVWMAESVMKRQPSFTVRWDYTHGVVFKGFERVWEQTRDPKYFEYIKENLNKMVNEKGEIQGYRVNEYNIDQINEGRILFTMYRETKEEKYKLALQMLRHQMASHPRTSGGGFWHKQIYPHQMWLDGIYMGSPFLAEYAKTFNEPALFDDVAKQITMIAKYTRDPKTGLLYHGWDESKQQKWANPQTGCSPHFWGRAMGWYAMALVDTLDYLPEKHPKRKEIIAILSDMMTALKKVQDKSTGLWYQVLDQGDRKGNYLEASASSMFVYAGAKGMRKGYLAKSFAPMVKKGYKGIIEKLIVVDKDGLLNLTQCNLVSGLGGRPRYRDGSFEYYISEPIVVNDNKAVGSFIMASVEMEIRKK